MMESPREARAAPATATRHLQPISRLPPIQPVVPPAQLNRPNRLRLRPVPSSQPARRRPGRATASSQRSRSPRPQRRSSRRALSRLAGPQGPLSRCSPWLRSPRPSNPLVRLRLVRATASNPQSRWPRPHRRSSRPALSRPAAPQEPLSRCSPWLPPPRPSNRPAPRQPGQQTVSSRPSRWHRFHPPTSRLALSLEEVPPGPCSRGNP